MERPGGNRVLDRQIAEILGWSDLVEIDGHIDLAGIPPGVTNREPVPFFSSIDWMARRVIEEFTAAGGKLYGAIPAEPWKVCEMVIRASKAQR